MMTDTSLIEPMPAAPERHVACRVVGRGSLTTHLVALDDNGSNGGRPTVCGLTRFDRFENGRPVPNSADLPGWGMGNSGVTGPGVRQVKCARCYELAEQAVGEPRTDEARTWKPAVVAPPRPNPDEAGVTSWTAEKLVEDLGEAVKRAEYFQTGEEGLLRRTTITIQNLLHHGHLEAEVRSIIRDLDTARAAGTVITYGHIQRRLQEALERSQS